jgi:hypothetical protein
MIILASRALVYVANKQGIPCRTTEKHVHGFSVAADVISRKDASLILA